MNPWPDNRIAAVIPAYRPPDGFVPYVETLLGTGCPLVIVVDDGSGESYAKQFDQLERLPRVVLLKHPINLGKGAALKTAFHRVTIDYAAAYNGVVTLDADGQHGLSDCLQVVSALAQDPESIVLGTRTFADDVPWRSRYGNIFTRNLFRLLYGQAVSDTQCGLRGLPMSFLPGLLKIPAQRYEFELDALILAFRAGRRPVEIEIDTIYVDDNAGSHFNPTFDSIRIYFVLFRFMLSSVAAYILDITVFYIAFAASQSIGYSLIAGRILATALNFYLNRNFVFSYRRKVLSTLTKFLSLVVFIAVASFAMITFFVDTFGVNILVAKVTAESGLFIFSFLAQRYVVFADMDMMEPNNLRQ